MKFSASPSICSVRISGRPDSCLPTGRSAGFCSSGPWWLTAVRNISSIGLTIPPGFMSLELALCMIWGVHALHMVTGIAGPAKTVVQPGGHCAAGAYGAVGRF